MKKNLNKDLTMDKIEIIENQSSEMLTILLRKNDTEKILFCGNYWDFNRDGKTFKELFKALGLNVKLIQKEDDYDPQY